MLYKTFLSNYYYTLNDTKKRVVALVILASIYYVYSIVLDGTEVIAMGNSNFFETSWLFILLLLIPLSLVFKKPLDLIMIPLVFFFVFYRTLLIVLLKNVIFFIFELAFVVVDASLSSVKALENIVDSYYILIAMNLLAIWAVALYIFNNKGHEK